MACVVMCVFPASYVRRGLPRSRAFPATFLTDYSYRGRSVMNRILTAFAAVALTCVYSTEAQTQNTAADTAYTPSQDFQSGRQVIAVYFGAS